MDSQVDGLGLGCLSVSGKQIQEDGLVIGSYLRKPVRAGGAQRQATLPARRAIWPERMIDDATCVVASRRHVQLLAASRPIETMPTPVSAADSPAERPFSD
jgi:hypothetical protein